MGGTRANGAPIFLRRGPGLPRPRRRPRSHIRVAAHVVGQVLEGSCGGGRRGQRRVPQAPGGPPAAPPGPRAAPPRPPAAPRGPPPAAPGPQPPRRAQGAPSSIPVVRQVRDVAAPETAN